MKGLDVYVGSDLYRAGTTPDGDDYIAEVYFLVAEATDGRRWRHKHHFHGAEAYTDPDGWEDWCDVRESAEADAVALLAKVLEAGKINLEHWVESYPAYGSSAYSEAETIAWERSRG